MRHSTITTETKKELQDNKTTQAKEWVLRCICPRPWRRAHFGRSLLACHHLWDWAISTRLDASSYLTSRNCTWSKQQGTSAGFTPRRAPSESGRSAFARTQTSHCNCSHWSCIFLFVGVTPVTTIIHVRPCVQQHVVMTTGSEAEALPKGSLEHAPRSAVWR